MDYLRKRCGLSMLECREGRNNKDNENSQGGNGGNRGGIRDVEARQKNRRK